MEMKAAVDNTLYEAEQGILLVLAHDTHDVYIKLPVVLAPRSKRDLLCVAIAQKGVKM